MRRTRTWWARLTPDERSWLVYFERSKHFSAGCSPYLPDDCGECGMCSSPSVGGGPCRYCLAECLRIVRKADEKEAKPCSS